MSALKIFTSPFIQLLYWRINAVNFLINIFYLIVGITICFASNKSGLPISKDELYYLSIAEEYSFADALATAKADSLNYLWPIILNLVGVDEYNKFYRYFGPVLYILALSAYVGKSQKIGLLAFIFSLPVFWYFGTYLRDGYVFIFTLFLLKLMEDIASEKLNNSGVKLLLFIVALSVLAALRFYYFFPFLILIIAVVLRGNGLLRYYFLMALFAIALIQADVVTYAIRMLDKIVINPVEIIRVFLNPFPSSSFGESVDRYESAMLYNVTFLFRLFNLFIAVPYICLVFFNHKLPFEYNLKLLFILSLAAIIVLTGNVGPRQSFVVGLLVFIFFLKLAHRKKF